MYLLPSTFEENQLKCTQVIAIFLKCVKRRNLNRKIQRTLEGSYLYDGWSDLSEIWNGIFPTRGNFHSKMV